MKEQSLASKWLHRIRLRAVCAVRGHQVRWLYKNPEEIGAGGTYPVHLHVEIAWCLRCGNWLYAARPGSRYRVAP